MAPMTLKTRKYYQLVASLAEKRRQQAAQNLKFISYLPQQLLPQGDDKPGDQEKEALPFAMPTEEEIARNQQERAQQMSVLEALQQASDKNSEGWVPFLPRSKL